MQPAGTIHIGPVTLLVPGFGVLRHSRLAFIVDDENSRNASDVGGDRERRSVMWRPSDVGTHEYGGDDTISGRILRGLR